MRMSALTPVFAEFIPEVLEPGKLYISQEYSTSVHKCCCGCGTKVVTPLSPTGWELTVEEGLVSLFPSIGNWSFPCQSHYWIERNEVIWSYQMTNAEVDAGRRRDARLKQRHYEQSVSPAPKPLAQAEMRSAEETFWQRAWRRLFG